MQVSKASLLASSTLAGVAALLALTAPSAAFAQDIAVVDATDAPVTAATSEVEELVITGSRIRVQDYVASNPVVSLTERSIEQSGVTNLTAYLQQIPALVNSLDLQDNSNAGDRSQAGLNLLNLRNLGTQRTLVLVDGRRHVSGSSGSASVDVNTIPIALIDRVEVLTGGASAVYGSDGVSGVVNFIMKKDFEGMDARFQRGWTQDGGGANATGSLLLGHNFHDGRGNVTLGAEFSQTDPIDRDDRHYSRLGNAFSLVENPANTGDNDGIPDHIFMRDVRYIDTSLIGSVYADIDFGNNLSGIDFLATGQPWVAGQYVGGFSMVGGSGTPVDIFQTQLAPGLDRKSVNGTFNYEVVPGHRLFGEAKFVRTNTQFVSQPSFDYGIVFLLDNPFIPDNIFNAAADPDTGLGNLFVARDNLDLGAVKRDIERDTLRTVIGFEGELFQGIDYEVSYVYGRTKETNIERNNRINERWYAALDVVTDPDTGRAVCRSDLDPTAAPFGDVFLPDQSVFNPDTFGSTFTPGPNSGCVPINIFAGPVSAEARDWVTVDSTDISRITQQVVTAYVSGDSQPWFSLPAGPLGFAAGVEWRREESDYTPDPILQLGAEVGYDITWLGQALPERGAFEVKEAFAEISAPVLRDRPFAKDVTVDAAYRYSEYSLSGPARSWRVGGQWRIIDDVMLRATRARAVRAPNISELFLPESQTFATLDDPCDKDNLALGRDPATRLANCQAALQPLGLNPTTFDNTFSASVPGIISGNRELGAETADTITAGIVLTPRFAPGLSLSLDYYDIELSDAINFFAAQDVVDNCYDLPQPNVYCTDLERSVSANPAQRGIITGFRQFGQNVASYTTAGYDFTANYRVDAADLFGRDFGTFNFRLVANKLEGLTFIEIAGVEPNSDVGEVGAPEWQANLDLTWLYGPLTVNYGYTWMDEVIRYADTYENQPEYIADEYKYLSARSVHDIQVRYAFEGGLELYAGINNFTNQEPDIGALQTPVGAEGRFFYIGGKGRLSDLF